jgi:hypothetical protein
MKNERVVEVSSFLAHGGQWSRTSVRARWIRLAAILREEMNACIGIDFCGLFVRNLHQDTGEDTSLESCSGAEDAHDGALDALQQLCSACDGNVCIISRAHLCRTVACLNYC